MLVVGVLDYGLGSTTHDTFHASQKRTFKQRQRGHEPVMFSEHYSRLTEEDFQQRERGYEPVMFSGQKDIITLIYASLFSQPNRIWYNNNQHRNNSSLS